MRTIHHIPLLLTVIALVFAASTLQLVISGQPVEAQAAASPQPPAAASAPAVAAPAQQALYGGDALRESRGRRVRPAPGADKVGRR